MMVSIKKSLLPSFSIRCDGPDILKERVNFLFDKGMLYSVHRYKFITEIQYSRFFCNRTSDCNYISFTKFFNDNDCLKIFYIYSFNIYAENMDWSMISGKMNMIISTKHELNLEDKDINYIMPFELFIDEVLPILQ